MEGTARKLGIMRGEPEWLIKLREEAEEYIKKAPFPYEIQPLDFSSYNPLGEGDVELPDIKSLDDIPENIRDMLIKMGVPEYEWEKVLGLIQVDTSSQTTSFKEYFEKQGVIVLSLLEAIKKFHWLKDYAFKLMPYKTNKFAAYHTAYWNGGIFMWIKKGAKIAYPLHTYFLITEGSLAQADHALIIAEEGAEATFIEGCTAPPLVRFSAHIGATEVYVKKGAKLKGIVLQNWPEYVNTRPYTNIHVEEDGEIEVAVAILGTGKSAGRYEEVHLNGKNAKATINSISFVKKNEHLDDVIKIYLNAPNTKGLIHTKGVIRDKGSSNSYTHIESSKNACYSQGHIECSGILLNSGGTHSTFPGVRSLSPGSELTHEAYVGKISEETLIYLMSRGLSSDDALALLVRGYIEPITKHIPFEYLKEINRIAELVAKGGF